MWERRRLVRQWNLDESELRFHGNLPGVEGKIFVEAINDRVGSDGCQPRNREVRPLSDQVR